MQLVVFLEFLQDNGAIVGGNIDLGSSAWQVFTDRHGTNSHQILIKVKGVPKEYVTKREADTICDQLKIRKAPGGMFDF